MYFNTDSDNAPNECSTIVGLVYLCSRLVEVGRDNYWSNYKESYDRNQIKRYEKAVRVIENFIRRRCNVLERIRRLRKNACTMTIQLHIRSFIVCSRSRKAALFRLAGDAFITSCASTASISLGREETVLYYDNSTTCQIIHHSIKREKQPLSYKSIGEDTEIMLIIC